MLEQDLALFGGTPVRHAAWPMWPYYADEEIEASAATLRSGRVNYWTGEQGRIFEEEYARYVGVRHAIACANGTLALELGLRSFGIGQGAEVIVPAKTFIASASAIVTVGAIPVVADVDPYSQCLSVETIKKALTPLTRAIIVVHLGGWPANMPEIMAFAREHQLMVVEDCAQAHGASIAGVQVGAFGDCAAFSFCQDKIISTGGEGGMLVFRESEAAWLRAWEYKDHGKSYAAVFQQTHPAGFRWLHESFGTNMRMTEPQATIGRIQLAKLDKWVKCRTENANALHIALQDIPGLICRMPPAEMKSAWYRYYAHLDLACLKPDWDQARIVTAISAEGVPCFVGSCSEIYREHAFSGQSYALKQPLPIAAQLSECSLAFLVHPTSSPNDMLDTAQAVRKVMMHAVAV